MQLKDCVCIPQESGCLQRYHEAIRLQQDGQSDGARALYHEILGSKVMDEVKIYYASDPPSLTLHSSSPLSLLFLPPSLSPSLLSRLKVEHC